MSTPRHKHGHLLARFLPALLDLLVALLAPRGFPLFLLAIVVVSTGANVGCVCVCSTVCVSERGSVRVRAWVSTS